MLENGAAVPRRKPAALVARGNLVAGRYRGKWRKRKGKTRGNIYGQGPICYNMFNHVHVAEEMHSLTWEEGRGEGGGGGQFRLPFS